MVANIVRNEIRTRTQILRPTWRYSFSCTQGVGDTTCTTLTFSESHHAEVCADTRTKHELTHISVKDVDAAQFINAYAQHLKRSGTYERWHVASKDHVDVSVVLYQRMETNR